ncbi:MAG: hypothetical protein ACT4OJ_09115, partial [Bacteroidota bacterium]
LKKFFFCLFILFLQFNLSGQSFPKYAATVGGKESGLIKRGEFLAQTDIGGIRWIGGNHWERIPIDSFSIIIIRDSVTILNQKIKGQIFTGDLRQKFTELRINDRVIFYGIYASNYNNQQVFIRPVELIIE